MSREFTYEVTVEARVYKSVFVRATSKREAASIALGDTDDPRIVGSTGLTDVGPERVVNVRRDSPSEVQP